MFRRRASSFWIPASVFDLVSRTGEAIEINGIGKEPLYLVSKSDYQILQELTSLEDEMLCRLGEERLRHFREGGEKAIPLDEVIRRTSFIGALPGVAKRYDGPTESVWPIDDHDETGE